MFYHSVNIVLKFVKVCHSRSVCCSSYQKNITLNSLRFVPNLTHIMYHTGKLSASQIFASLITDFH